MTEGKYLKVNKTWFRKEEGKVEKCGGMETKRKECLKTGSNNAVDRSSKTEARNWKVSVCKLSMAYVLIASKEQYG